MQQDKASFIAVDILDDYYRLQNLTTIKLNHGQICEIIRQILEMIDRDFVNFVTNLKTLNFDLIFYNQAISQNCIEELNQVVQEVSLSIFFNLQQYKLLRTYSNETGFPFFPEHITSNTLYLRVDTENFIPNQV